MTTDDKAAWWRMNWLRKADNQLAQDKAVVKEEEQPYRPIPRYPTNPQNQSSVRSQSTTQSQYNNSNDGMLTGAMLGYWIASSNKSSESSSSSDSYDSSSFSSDSGSFSSD